MRTRWPPLLLPVTMVLKLHTPKGLLTVIPVSSKEEKNLKVTPSFKNEENRTAKLI